MTNWQIRENRVLVKIDRKNQAAKNRPKFQGPKNRPEKTGLKKVEISGLKNKAFFPKITKKNGRFLDLEK